MQPVRTLWEKIADLLAADTVTLAAVPAPKVHLAKNAFVPGLDLTLAGLTEAAFTGYAALAAGAGTQPTFYDAASGLYSILLLEPAGGFHWECTVAPAPAETIYGFYVTDNAGAVLYGAERFVTPLVISMANQGIDVEAVKLRFSTGSPT